VSWVKYDASQYGFYLLGVLDLTRKLPLVRKDHGALTSSVAVVIALLFC
jgi:hypothetical protein